MPKSKKNMNIASFVDHTVNLHDNYLFFQDLLPGEQIMSISEQNKITMTTQSPINDFMKTGNPQIIYEVFSKMAKPRKGLIDRLKLTMMSKKWDPTLDKIMRGEYLLPQDANPFDTMEDNVISKLQSSTGQLGANDTLSKRLAVLTTCYPEAEFNYILKTWNKPLNKNKCFANLFAVRGDKFQETSEFEIALPCYNLAVSYAPSGSQILAEIYAKRASMFLKTNEPSLALSDIETALTFPDISINLRSDLERQKQNCLSMAETTTTTTPAKMVNWKHPTYTENVIFRVEGENNPTMPSADACIEMRFEKGKGRHLITTQDLEPGITVIVEEPYVTIINNCMQWELNQCFACFTRISRTVPCLGCVFAIYCSDKCRKQDYDGGHKYLCQCASYIHGAGLGIYQHLGLKAICRAGPEYMFKVYQESLVNDPESQERDSKLIPGFDPESGIYNSDSHHQIMKLITLREDDTDYLNRLAFVSMLSAKALEARSDFFVQIREDDKPGFFQFISLVILQHSLGFPHNGFELYMASKKKHQDESENKEIPKSRLVKSGDGGMTGIYSLCSMINHACEPNVMWQQSRDGRLAVVTKQKLKAGDELFFSYGQDYMTFNYEHRQAWLSGDYQFKCECIACRLDWPTLENIPSRQPFLCQRCTNSTYSRPFINEVCWLKQKGEKLKCKYCHKKFKMSALVDERKKREDMMDESYKLISSNKPLDALPLVLECISYFQTNIRSPCKDLIICQEYLEAVYDDIIDL